MVRLSQFAALIWLLSQALMGQQPQQPSTLTAPDLRTLSLQEAVSLIKHRDLYFGSTTYVDSDQPRDIVVDQRPSPGSTISHTTPINLTVSNGIPPQGGAPSSDNPPVKTELPSEVPNLVGLPVGDAETVLSKSRLLVGEITSLANSRPKGTVFYQSVPYPGRVPRGTRIDLSVSAGDNPAPSFPIVLWGVGAAGVLALFGAAAFVIGRESVKALQARQARQWHQTFSSGIEFRPHRAWGTQTLTPIRPAGIDLSISFSHSRDPGQQILRVTRPGE